MGCAASTSIHSKNLYLAKIFDAITDPQQTSEYADFEHAWAETFRENGSQFKKSSSTTESVPPVQSPRNVMELIKRSDAFKEAQCDLDEFLRKLPCLVERCNDPHETFVRKKALWIALLHCKYWKEAGPMTQAQIEQFQKMTRFYIAREEGDNQAQKKHLYVLPAASNSADIMTLSTWYKRNNVPSTVTFTKEVIGANAQDILGVY